jgi:hypothetical protein
MGEITTLVNGSEYDHSTGRIVKGAKLDTAQATALARQRWDKQKAAWEAGVISAIKDTGLLPPQDDQSAGAWQAIANKATTVLLDTDNARGFSELATLVGRNAGWIASATDKDAPAPGIVRLDVDANTLLDMLRTVRAEAEARDVVDVDIVE